MYLEAARKAHQRCHRGTLEVLNMCLEGVEGCSEVLEGCVEEAV